MKHGRYGWSYLLLRLGLGLTFLWIGIDMFRNPDAWIGYLPEILPLGIGRGAGLPLIGLIDAGIGILFLTNSFPRAVALIAATHVALIVASNGLDPTIIRDVGLFGATAALVLWPHHRRTHRLRNMLPKLPSFRRNNDT